MLCPARLSLLFWIAADKNVNSACMILAVLKPAYVCVWLCKLLSTSGKCFQLLRHQWEMRIKMVLSSSSTLHCCYVTTENRSACITVSLWLMREGVNFGGGCCWWSLMLNVTVSLQMHVSQCFFYFSFLVTCSAIQQFPANASKNVAYI